MTKLSDQIKNQIHMESIKEKAKIVNDVKKQHKIQKGSLNRHWNDKIKTSQENYLEKLQKENDRI